MSSSMSRFMISSLMSKNPSRKSTSLAFNPFSHASFLKNQAFPASRFDGSGKITRPVFVVRSSITPPPGAPLPAGSPSGSLRNWVVGIVLTVVLPFFTHKWGPLILLKNKVDAVVDTAEHIVEAIEAVAERVDHVIDDFTDDLPEDSKLRKTMESVDQMVEGVAKSAHIANDIIDKVEEAEENLESILRERKEEASQEVKQEEVPIEEPTDQR